jgi:2-dehydropantoate 2-reductase
MESLDPGRRLRNFVARANVVGGVVYSANEVVAPGVIRNFVPGNNMLVIGDADNRNPPVVQELRRALERSGMSSPPPQDIRQAVWAKLVQNLGSASLCLLTETTTSGITEDPGLKALSARMKAEATAIAAAHGVDIGRAPHRPSGGHVSGAIGHKPSMLQDYLKGRPMEIEAQLMAPHAFARAANVATPTLDIVIPLAAHKAMSKGLYRPFRV